MAPTAVLDPLGRPSKRPKLATKSAHSKVHSDDESLSDGMLEKDETELRLEKLLFGDEAGFLDSLRTESRSQTRALVADPSQKSDVDTDEEDLDEVADEDVRAQLSPTSCSHLFSHSCSSSILGLVHCLLP